MDYRIFNVCTDVHACDYTVKESVLKVDSGRKIPCRTQESNLCQWCATRMLYQLSYIPTQMDQNHLQMKSMCVLNVCFDLIFWILAMTGVSTFFYISLLLLTLLSKYCLSLRTLLVVAGSVPVVVVVEIVSSQWGWWREWWGDWSNQDRRPQGFQNFQRLVSWCFKPSQLPWIISALKDTFIKRILFGGQYFKSLFLLRTVPFIWEGSGCEISFMA